MNKHSAGNRDKNEPLITEVLRRYGIDYCLMPIGAGFDILIFLSPMKCVEVKNPDVPPSKRRLTDCEKERQAHCEVEGIEYDVVETPEEMARLAARWLM